MPQSTYLDLLHQQSAPAGTSDAITVTDAALKSDETAPADTETQPQSITDSCKLPLNMK